MAVILKEALKSFFKEQEIVEKIEENTIYVLWEEIVGINISKVTKIEKIKNNIIYIKQKTQHGDKSYLFKKKN